MSATPRVSVVLPAYNAGPYLAESVDSILNQEERDLELILVDDGSSDGSVEALDDSDPRLRLIRGPHRGLVAALDCGLETACAPYIARMDADDISTPDRIGVQADFLDERPDIGLVASQVEYWGDVSANEGLARFVDWNNSLIEPDEIALNRFVESPLIHPSVMFRRDVVVKHGGYREGNFPEDYDLWLRWLEAGVRMTKAPRAMLRWRDRPERLTRADSRYSTAAFWNLKIPFLARRLRSVNPFWPEVGVWGAGRTARKRLEPLSSEGVKVRFWVDIDRKKIGWEIDGVPVLSPDQIPRDAFILSAVAKLGARELIARELRARGFVLGRDYVAVA